MRKMDLVHVPSIKSMHHRPFSISTIASPAFLLLKSVCTISDATLQSSASPSAQSTLISILFPSGSRTQVESPLPFDPLLTSAGEGSMPLRLNVAITS